MEDDELADQAQQILDNIDLFLANVTLVAKLTSLDLLKLFQHRYQVNKMLTWYRDAKGIPKRRPPRPAIVQTGPRRGMLVSAVLVLSSWGPGTAAVASGATGLEIATVLGETLLPIGALFMLTQLSGDGPSPSAQAEEGLRDSVDDLAKDLLELSMMAQIVAITAEQAAKLSVDELLDLLRKVAMGKGVQAAAQAILLAELAKRFAKCAGAIKALKDAIAELKKAANVLTSNYWAGTVGRWAKAGAAVSKALDELRTCIGLATSK